MKVVTKTVFKVGDFVSWAQTARLDLQPRFQRRAVWKPGAKSYLIDTIIRNLPIPIIFLRDRLAIGQITTMREVVDGQQRLRTILSYIDSSLVADYDPEAESFQISKSHNKELAGKAFGNLEPAWQRAIIGYEIPVHIFSADTEDRDILQIFARLNATGVKLNDQELRNAEFFGVFKTLSYQIAYENLNRWISWGVFTLAEISRMAEVEEVSDLIVTMHQGVHGKKKSLLTEYYEKYDLQYADSAHVSKRFEGVMSALENALGDVLSNTQFSRKALFGDLFVATYHLLYGLNSALDGTSKPKKLPADFRSVICQLSDSITFEEVSEKMQKSLRGGTSDYGSRLTRANFILSDFGHVLT